MINEENRFNKFRDKILDVFLIEAELNGINEKTLLKSAKSLNVDKTEIYRYFPEGLNEIKNLFFKRIDKEMIKKFSKLKTQEMKIREKISNAIICRFEILQKNKKVVINIFSLECINPFRVLRRIWETADIIWGLAGDKSTDFNYYSKRLLLSWVYLSTISCWIDDKDKKFKDTKVFLDKRISEVLLFGQKTRKIKERISNQEISNKILNIINQIKSIKT